MMVIRVRSWGLCWGRRNTSRGYRSILVRMVVVVVIGQGVELLFSSIGGLTPQIESPINECAGEFIDIGVFHDDGPIANR